MSESNFLPKKYASVFKNGILTWESPSNIALVKYWGKYGEQLPANPSVSFTLNNCKTTTKLIFQLKETPDQEFEFDVFFEGKKSEDFKPKIDKFFKRVEKYLPFITRYVFEIHTVNTFPHSSGIASSASGMSALACCLIALEKSLTNEQLTEEYWIQKTSFIARLGSGSACRSLEGDIVVWGEHSKIKGSSNLFGIKYPYKVHDNFNNYLFMLHFMYGITWKKY